MTYRTDSEDYSRRLVVTAEDLEHIAATNLEVGRQRGVLTGICYANVGWFLLCALYLALMGAR